MKPGTRLAAFVLPTLLLAGSCANDVDPPFTETERTLVDANIPDAASNPPATVLPLPIIDPVKQLVAHAGGNTAQGKKYTNTIDAFIQSYNQGFRTFEFDFVRLADGTVLAAHDGTESRYGLAPNEFHSATLQDVQGLTYNDQYRVMFAQDIINLLREYPDITIIADAKWDLAETYQVFFDAAGGDLSILNRLIPHVGTQEELDAMRAINPEVDPILALYRTQYLPTSAMTDDEVIDFVTRNNISAVMMRAGLYDPKLTMPENNAREQRFSPEFVERLRALGVTCYVHTVDDLDEVRRFLEENIYVYTNAATPTQILELESTGTTTARQANTPPPPRPLHTSFSSILGRNSIETATQIAADQAISIAFARPTIMLRGASN